MSKIKFTLLSWLLGMFVAFAAGCGGGDASFIPDDDDGSNSGNGSGTGIPGSGAQTGVATTVVTSFPFTDSIEDLGGGVYSRRGSAIVTDEDGNAVRDGTQVYLKIIDSIKASGVITTADGDSIAGTRITDVVPFLADGVTAASFDTAYVNRNGSTRFIQSQDQVFLFNAEGRDVARSVGNGALAATTLDVTNAYSVNYPNATYGTGTSSFIVGASHIGAEVAGVDAQGIETTGIGATVNGIVNFVVKYPANPDTLNVGCLADPADDTRYTPSESAQVYLAAYVPGTSAGVIDNRFCFSRIAGGTLTSAVTGISGTQALSLLFRDGGDTVPVPFAQIDTSVSITGTVNVTTDCPCTTGANGFVTPTITVAGGASGDTATVTFYVASEPDIQHEVTVTVP